MSLAQGGWPGVAGRKVREKAHGTHPIRQCMRF